MGDIIVNSIVFVLQNVQPIRCNWKNIADSYPNISFVLLTSNLLRLSIGTNYPHFKKNITVRIFDIEHISNLVESYLKENKIGKEIKLYFVSNDEYSLIILNKLREKYNVFYGCSIFTEQYFNKIIMKSVLTRDSHDFLTPNFYKLTNNADSDLSFIRKSFSFPLIGKPAIGSNNRGVKLLKSERQLITWLRNAGPEYEIEEFISGKMFHCNIYCDKSGKLHSLLVGEYLNPCLCFDDGEPIGSIFLPRNNPLFQRAIEFGEKVIRKLGEVTCCVYHLEFFLTPDDKLIFLEIASRAPGGMLSNAAYSILGIDVEQLNFILQFDPDVENNVKIKFQEDQYAFWCWLPKQLGHITRGNLPELSSPSHVEWYIKDGDNITEDMIAGPACGIIATNSNFGILYKDFEKLKTAKLETGYYHAEERKMKL